MWYCFILSRFGLGTVNRALILNSDRIKRRSKKGKTRTKVNHPWLIALPYTEGRLIVLQILKVAVMLKASRRLMFQCHTHFLLGFIVSDAYYYLNICNNAGIVLLRQFYISILWRLWNLILRTTAINHFLQWQYTFFISFFCEEWR